MSDSENENAKWVPRPWDHGQMIEYDPETYQPIVPAWKKPFVETADHLRAIKEQGKPGE